MPLFKRPDTVQDHDTIQGDMILFKTMKLCKEDSMIVFSNFSAGNGAWSFRRWHRRLDWQLRNDLAPANNGDMRMTKRETGDWRVARAP